MSHSPYFLLNNPDNDSKFDAGLNELKGAMDNGELSSGKRSELKISKLI